MPRKPTILIPDRPYHITARANNCEWFYLPMPEVWRIFTEKLAQVSEAYGMRVIAFVLMNNHYHLIALFPLANLGEAMNYLQREVSRSIGKASGRINHVFGGRCKSCLISDVQYLQYVYKYVYRNPVQAGLCGRVQDYPFSTLRTVLGHASVPFPVWDEIAIGWSPIPTSIPERLEWLNESVPRKKNELVQHALRRTVFSFPRDNTYRSELRDLLPGKVAGT